MSPDGDPGSDSGPGSGSGDDRDGAEFNEERFTDSEHVPLGEARERLLGALEPTGRSRTRRTVDADGAVLAAAVTADRDVPGYERAAMDGYAVRAADTAGASPEAPVALERTTGPVGAGQARSVHTGSELPAGADAVVRVERTRSDGETVTVTRDLPDGKNVAPPDEDVAAGERLFEPGHRLRPPDLGLLKSVGVREVEVRAPPRVSVVPTGEELVDRDPEPGEVVETNGLTVTRYAERWGGAVTYRSHVTDDAATLRGAIERDLDHDAVVTIGGTSVGQRDLVPDVVAGLGRLLVHGVAIKPGHPVGAGLVDGTPVLMAPGYPVSAVVVAVQFLRPALARLGGWAAPPHPSLEARLTEGVESDPGRRTYERVRLTDADGTDADEGGARRTAEPVRAAGAGVLSSVGRADGWLEVPERVTGLAAGDTVTIQDWDRCR